MKKIYFIGGTSVFGSNIVKILTKDFDVKSVGIETGHEYTGYNCQNEIKILDEMIEHQTIIIYTDCRGKQSELLVSFFKKALIENWKGHLISFSSTSLFHNSCSMKELNEPWRVLHYRKNHASVYKIHDEINYISDKIDFKFTSILCGMRSNEKMKKFKSYRINCLHPEDFANIIKNCISLSNNINVKEIILDAK